MPWFYRAPLRVYFQMPSMPQEMEGLGIFDSVAGLGLGFVLLLPPYFLRANGGGRRKAHGHDRSLSRVKGVMGAFVYILLAGGSSGWRWPWFGARAS